MEQLSNHPLSYEASNDCLVNSGDAVSKVSSHFFSMKTSNYFLVNPRIILDREALRVFESVFTRQTHSLRSRPFSGAIQDKKLVLGGFRTERACCTAAPDQAAWRPVRKQYAPDGPVDRKNIRVSCVIFIFRCMG